MTDLYLFTLSAAAIGIIAGLLVKIWFDTNDEDWPG